jgi:sugar (glycoside-pentoside-hexuronide) transporter
MGDGSPQVGGSESMQPLTRRQIFGYTVGDLGINLNFQLIGFYLAYFYTDVFGLSPAHVAGLFLVARIWDAINDPLMGYIADRTETKRGKFRPFILFGALPLNLILIACYFTPELSDTAKIAYAYSTYILHGMLFTLVGLPYSALTAVMTQDQQERSVISTYRMFFAVAIAVTLVAVGVRPFVAQFETEQQGFAVTAGIFAFLSTALLWYAYRNSEERVKVPRENYKISEIIPMLVRNDALLVLGGAMLLNTCVWVVKNAVATYYFKYLWDDASGNLQSVFFLVMQGAAVAGALAAPALTKRFGKRRVFMAASIVVAVFYATRQFVPLGFLVPLFAISLFGDFAQMICSITQWGMVPDTVEYGHWKTGVRSEGMPYAFFSLMQKMGLALGGAFAAMMLGWTGYVANAEQSASAVAGIEWSFNLVPAAFSILCFLMLYLYKVDGPFFERITRELEEREASGEG